jgi:adenylate cyclase
MTQELRRHADTLRRTAGIELRMRVGLNSGEAVVGWTVGDLGGDATLGHPVSLAKRMEALAAPGSVYLTQATASLVEGWFLLQDLGTMTVKGSRAPIRVYLLGGPTPGQPVSARRPGSTRHLIGRGPQMAILERALARASNGEAQIVSVVGGPGVGKSRLCDEFARSAQARGFKVRRCSGVSHGREVPLLPVLALMRDYFDITDDIGPTEARQRTSTRLLELDPGFHSDLPVVFDFLEIADEARPLSPMTGDARIRRVLEVLRRVTTRRSEREVLVLVLEDVQWFDPQSLAFFEHLIDGFAGSRTMTLANFRTEFAANWRHRPGYQQMPLGPLPPDAVQQMLRELVGEHPSLAPLPAYLVERTGGNPFFVEELLRALAEDGTLEGSPRARRLVRPLKSAVLPAGVHSVLAARIDRLPPNHKLALQRAAVIGDTFAVAVLARVMGTTVDATTEALSALCVAELLREHDRVAGGEYRFWHPLTQEVAYGTMLSRHRSQLHASVAEALMHHESERLDEKAAVVAWHWAQAGRKLEAAEWTLRAGEFALRSDLAEARRRWRAAVDLANDAGDEPTAWEIGLRARCRLLQFGARLGITSEEADRLESEGRSLAARLRDDRLIALITVFSGSARFWTGDLRGALVRFMEGANHGERSDDPHFKAAMWIGASYVFSFTGPLAEGLAWGSRAIEACVGDPECGRTLIGYGALARVHLYRATVLARMGRLPKAAQDVDMALELARPRGEPETVSYSLATRPFLAWLTGDTEPHLADAAEAVRLAEQTGNPAALVMALEGTALGHLVARNSADAIAASRRALTLAREEHCALYEEASLLAYLALAYGDAGNAPAAKDAAEEAVEAARRQGAMVNECLALLVRARLGRLATRDHTTVADDIAMNRALVVKVGARTFEPFLSEELGRLTNDRRIISEAIKQYRAIGAPGHARRIDTELRRNRVPWD